MILRWHSHFNRSYQDNGLLPLPAKNVSGVTTDNVFSVLRPPYKNKAIALYVLFSDGFFPQHNFSYKKALSGTGYPYLDSRPHAQPGIQLIIGRVIPSHIFR
ncbi:Uncharacterised protein [Yersinia kristensenii]|nr:Uncharacterised protein [Yersinia kristensenii]